MAKLTSVYRSEDMSGVKFGKRQLPLAASGDNNLMMLMDLNSKGLVFDHPYVKGKELEEFTRKYNILSTSELKQSLEVSRTEFISVLSQSVPCVGCRRSVERLFYQLMHSGHPTLDPVVITSTGVLTVQEEKIAQPQAICTLLHKHNVLLNSLLENQPRNKKSSRCTLHSLDSFRSKPFSDMWREVWNCMKQQCRDEIAHIDAEELHNTLDEYLKKHKFCQDCRTKVEKAYSLLVNESNPKEKGYVAALYSNIKKCIADKHIHLQTKADFIDSLIKRAEPELNGSNSRHRERHAKTLEIAQEEVLTCIGMFIYERLRRVHMCLKEEENACQVLAAVAVHALSRSFDMAVENKRGISNLELLFKEISRAEKAKELRKEQKKLKKKKKKNEKKCLENGNGSGGSEERSESPTCSCSGGNSVGGGGGGVGGDGGIVGVDDEIDDLDEPTLINNNNIIINTHGSGGGGGSGNNCCNHMTTSELEPNRKLLAARNVSMCCTANLPDAILIDVKEMSLLYCHSCDRNNGGESNGCSIDGGYVSEPSNHDGLCSVLSSRTPSITSSPEGSEVACSDGFCNHDLHGGGSGSGGGGGSVVINNGGVVGNHNHHHHHHHGMGVGAKSMSELNFSRNHHHNHSNVVGNGGGGGGGGCGKGGSGNGGELPLTLQQMLADTDERDVSTIPDEVVLDYKCRQQNIKALREELRQDLRKKFAQMCVKTRLNGQKVYQK